MLPNFLMKRVQLTPDRKALQTSTVTYTFRQMMQEADLRARSLYAQGVRSHARVALRAPSTVDTYLMIQACLLLQVELVLLNSRLTREEIDYQLEDAEVAYIVTDDFSFFEGCAIPLIALDDIREGPAISFPTQMERDATASIMYTSGTTGFPKGVRQTYGNHTANAMASVTNLGFLPTDCWLCTMPLFHISGLSIVMRSLLYGMPVYLMEKFDALKSAQLIQEGTVTIMSVVAPTLRAIIEEMEQREWQASPKFRLMLAGGGVIPESYIERANTLNLPIVQTYGMTETSSQTATLSSEDSLRKLGSVGKPLFFNDLKVGASNTPYEHGEIYVRGPHVTPGYIGKFADNSPLQDGWLATGDLGYFDEEGYLYILDRRKDLIISGGENIYPAEIEKVLARHEAIIEAGVCGVSDDQWGEVPAAYIVCEGKVTEEEIIQFCAQHLARYKIPKHIYFCETLPRNASNKLLRRELRAWNHSKSNM